MKRLMLSTGMMMGLLAAATTFAADTPPEQPTEQPSDQPTDQPSEPALTDKPACKGPQVDAELYGTYKAPAYGEQKAMKLTFEKYAVTFEADDVQPVKAKAWTCMKDGAMVLVIMKEPSKYMCQMITTGGDYLVSVGDVPADKPIEPGEMQSLMKDRPPTIFKKQAAPSGGY